MGTTRNLMRTINRPAQRLAETVRYAAGVYFAPADDMVFLEPYRLRSTVETAVAGATGRVRVAGTLDRRLLCVERRDVAPVALGIDGKAL
jgi:hypothetical protein